MFLEFVNTPTRSAIAWRGLANILLGIIILMIMSLIVLSKAIQMKSSECLIKIKYLFMVLVES